ncbi:glycosyltransferase [Pseudonocardia alaniniphila]|uniref:Glycosyltransferase n=1 Tax=Pseudonocardia alaniniphila TaxID=75291 RepID=A0ABS9TQN3_9PSEU|nr:glycosyltransferase [Pseudonocardia alaniniphila]MCH6170842.1 glycosyltransferase [Pseudonocardia alaniniphila]
MRVARVVESAAEDREVVVVVVPVAGEPLGNATIPGVQRVVRIEPGAGANPRPALIRMLAQPEWRDRLQVSGILPRAARAAPPMLADDIFSALGRPTGWAVHVARAGLAPLGVALAELLDAPFATLDLDDDDESLLRRLGEHAEAHAHRRLLSAFAGCFSGIWLAAPQEAAAVAARHGVPTAVLPNAIRIPASPQHVPSSPPDLLFVGNLSYQPNVDAATALVEQVQPRVRERTGLPITVSVVGHHGGDPRILSLSRHPGVMVRGFVNDLTELYARASVVVAPLTDAAGTRIKLLEAFAHTVPVVATPAAAAGLAVQDGTHLSVGRTFAELASHVATLLADPQAGARMAGEARRYVEENHSPPVVAAQVHSLLRMAAETAERAHPDGPARTTGRIPVSQAAITETESAG